MKKINHRLPNNIRVRCDLNPPDSYLTHFLIPKICIAVICLSYLLTFLLFLKYRLTSENFLQHTRGRGVLKKGHIHFILEFQFFSLLKKNFNAFFPIKFSKIESIKFTIDLFVIYLLTHSFNLLSIRIFFLNCR